MNYKTLLVGITIGLVVGLAIGLSVSLVHPGEGKGQYQIYESHLGEMVSNIKLNQVTGETWMLVVGRDSIACWLAIPRGTGLPKAN